MRAVDGESEMVGDARTTEHEDVAAPVLLRWRSAGFVSSDLVDQLQALGSRTEAAAAKAVLQEEDAPVRRPRFLVSGWACRFRSLLDGRRQIFDFVLPGEGVGVRLRASPLANTSTAALTPVRLIDARPLLQPEALAACKDLGPALLAQADADERRALNQIVRLGRLTALERIAHLFLELHERLDIVGLAQGERFPMPVTQETLADVSGLSVVHVNRTMQDLKRNGLVQVERGWVRLTDRDALARLADFMPKRTLGLD